MLDSLSTLKVVGTLRRPSETPFNQIVLGENSSMTKETEKSGNIWPRDLVPYQKPDSDASDEDEDPTLVQRNRPNAPV